MIVNIKARLTFWYALIFAVVLLLGSALFYVTLSRTLYRQLDRSLGAAATEFASDDFYGPTWVKPNALAKLDADGEAVVTQYDVQLLGLSGAPVANLGPANTLARAAVLPAVDRARRGLPAEFADIALPKQAAYRVFTTPVSLDGHPAGVIQIGASTAGVRHTLDVVRALLAGGDLLTLLVLVGSGLWVAGRALAPIDAITAVARQITASDLSRRLPVAKRSDELNRLAVTLNSMIARLQGALERERRFTSDASHELNTPLAVICGNAELLASDLREGRAADPAMVEDIQAEAERLSRLVRRLLTLTRLDRGSGGSDGPTSSLGRITFAQVNVGSMLHRAARHIQALAPELRVDVAAPDDLWAAGDADLLEELLSDLTANAVKYTPPPGVITLAAEIANDRVAVTVRDTGVGIPAAELPLLGQRFYRGDRPDSRGVGLGLAICREIMAAHGGSLVIASEPGRGSAFTAEWPLHPQTSDSLKVNLLA